MSQPGYGYDDPMKKWHSIRNEGDGYFFVSFRLFTVQKRTRHREIGDKIGICFFMSFYANGSQPNNSMGRKRASERHEKKNRFGNLPMAFHLHFKRNIKTSLAVRFFFCCALSSLLNDKIVTSFVYFFHPTHILRMYLAGKCIK